MRIYYNGIYRDMTAEEETAFMSFAEQETTENKDGLTSLAEGLSTANNMKDVQEAAKNILENEGK